jgi:YHS domain-containing protein
MARDPVCGRFISAEEAIGQAFHEGEAYHFCSAVCRDAFAREPGQFVVRPLLPPA